MIDREVGTTPRFARPQRAIAWVLLLASTVAVLVVGVLATGLIFGRLGAWPTPRWAFWWRLVAVSGLTIASLSIRSLRWVFLLRRAETRIPIRDAYIGYFAGLSLLFAPLLLGEITVRALINRQRGRVPFVTTAVVNLWERGMDLVALAAIAGLAALASGRSSVWTFGALAVVGATLVPSLRRLALSAVVAVAGSVTRFFEQGAAPGFDRLASQRTWIVGLAASVVAWLLPGMGLWLLATEFVPTFSLVDAELAYAGSAAAGGLLLAPAGVSVTGPRMIEAVSTYGGPRDANVLQMLMALASNGLPSANAVLTVFGVRLATVGTSIALGCLFVLVHLRTSKRAGESHFDEIAEAYDVQIPLSRRIALLDRKTSLMASVVAAHRIGALGLDVGCGQGAYVARMRGMGFDVSGIDASARQVELATKRVGLSGQIRLGSTLDIPAKDSTFDFLYIINVLHHLDSVEEQRRAFVELFRVLKPGGVLFVHEINTRNLLFRFYMGYVFPSLNCIDEGVERWLRPDRLSLYTGTPVAEVHYFTFLPDFVPRMLARVLRPVEQLLEASLLRRYSAHYMAVFIKEVAADR